HPPEVGLAAVVCPHEPGGCSKPGVRSPLSSLGTCKGRRSGDNPLCGLKIGRKSLTLRILRSRPERPVRGRPANGENCGAFRGGNRIDRTRIPKMEGTPWWKPTFDGSPRAASTSPTLLPACEAPHPLPADTGSPPQGSRT